MEDTGTYLAAGKLLDWRVLLMWSAHAPKVGYMAVRQ